MKQHRHECVYVGVGVCVCVVGFVYINKLEKKGYGKKTENEREQLIENQFLPS